MYNEYNQYYLAHHGIVGMKWGKRNGPPYPLNASTHNRIVKRGKKVGSGEDLRYKLTKAALKYGPALQGGINVTHPLFKGPGVEAIADIAKSKLQQRSLNRNKNLKKMDNDIDDNDGNIKSKGQMLKDAEFTSKTVGSRMYNPKDIAKSAVKYFEDPYLKINGKTYTREDLLTSNKLLDKLSDDFDKVYENIDKKVSEAYYKPRFKTKGGNKVSIEDATNARMLLNMISNKLSSKKVSKKSVGKMPKGALKALAVLNPAMARSLPDAIVAAKTYKSSFGAMKEAAKKNTKNGRVDMTDDNFWNWYEDYFTALDENMRKNGLY